MNYDFTTGTNHGALYLIVVPGFTPGSWESSGGHIECTLYTILLTFCFTGVAQSNVIAWLFILLQL